MANFSVLHAAKFAVGNTFTANRDLPVLGYELRRVHSLFFSHVEMHQAKCKLDMQTGRAMIVNNCKKCYAPSSQVVGKSERVITGLGYDNSAPEAL